MHVWQYQTDSQFIVRQSKNLLFCENFSLHESGRDSPDNGQAKLSLKIGGLPPKNLENSKIQSQDFHADCHHWNSGDVLRRKSFVLFMKSKLQCEVHSVEYCSPIGSQINWQFLETILNISC